MTSSQPQPTGDCFTAACKFITRPEIQKYPTDYRLVHGLVAHLPQDVPYNHAWVEEGDFVYEVSNGQFEVMSTESYYRAHGVTTVRKFTPEEALALAVRHEHWGPWE